MQKCIQVLFSVGDYRISKKLGSGISSNVYLASDRQQQQVAVKIYRDDCISTFEDELSAYQKLEHPHILKLIGFYRNIAIYDPQEIIKVNDRQSESKRQIRISKTNELPLEQGRLEYVYKNCIIIEYAQYGELFEFLIKGRLEESVAQFWFQQLLKVFVYIHNRGFAHLDIKPENVFVTSSLQLKVGDFGGSVDNSVTHIAALRNRVGTLSYMAPEIIKKQKYNGICADIFSLGVLLFIMISGHPPFNYAIDSDPYYNLIIANKPKEFWNQHQKHKIKFIYSPSFKQLITMMLQPNPASRPTLSEVIGHQWTCAADLQTNAQIQSIYLELNQIRQLPLPQEVKSKKKEVTRAMKIPHESTYDSLDTFHQSSDQDCLLHHNKFGFE